MWTLLPTMLFDCPPAFKVASVARALYFFGGASRGGEGGGGAGAQEVQTKTSTQTKCNLSYKIRTLYTCTIQWAKQIKINILWEFVSQRLRCQTGAWLGGVLALPRTYKYKCTKLQVKYIHTYNSHVVRVRGCTPQCAK